MASLPKAGWWFFCFLFLWETIKGAELQCSPVDPVAAEHPVQGLLERFQVSQGCAAREQGNKETHVIALQQASSSPGNVVMVFLKPPSSVPLRALHLVLSSMHPITWSLKAELLPQNLPVVVQVSPNSSVRSQTLHLCVQMVPSLPFRLRKLYHWALKHHGNLTSLIHTTQANWVYIQLGEDPSLPDVCQLQSLPLFPNYMTSDLQPQKVKCCTPPRGGEASPEVHVIKLRSAGSALSGSLQVEVKVTLLPPAAPSEPHQVVLILSSLVPVNWVITAPAVWGHITVHSSNSVSPPFPPGPNLTLSSRLVSDLSTVSNPLMWASESGYTNVRSYTEADLANRFVIQLAEDGTGQERLPVVNCEGGLLSVTVDLQKLQSLSLPAAAMTLRDQGCQAVSNGSHFLLALPVIFCGTEGELQKEPRGVLYKNMLLLWRDKPQSISAHGENGKLRQPFSLHISCFAKSHSKSTAAADNVTLPLIGRFTRGVQQHLHSVPPPRHLPPAILRSGPALHLRLFVTDSYEQTWTGPCVITAEHRVFAEISARASLADVVQVKSCFVSPQSDPKKSPFWTVIQNGCSSDSSFNLDTKTNGDSEDEKDPDETDGLEGGGYDHKERRFPELNSSTLNIGYLGQIRRLRFSFILRPVYNEPMQFVHCSLLLCLSDSADGKPWKEAAGDRCMSGTQIPPLVSGSSRHQCVIRNLSRPMVVTRPISSLVTKTKPSAGPRTNRTQSSGFMLQEGLLMGIVFAAFLVGVSLMGGLWCIYTYTGRRLEPFRDGPLTNQTHGGCKVTTPSFPSDQSSSSV